MIKTKQYNAALIGFVLIAIAVYLKLFFFEKQPIIQFAAIIAIVVSYYSKNFVTILLAAIGIIAIVLIHFPKAVSSEEFMQQFFLPITAILIITWLIIYLKKITKEKNIEKIYHEAIFSNASEGIFILDANGEILHANPHVREMFGYRSEELIGKAINILIPGIHMQKEDRISGNGEIQETGHTDLRELIAKRKNKGRFPVETGLRTFMMQDMPLNIAFISDITYRKEAEEKLRRLNLSLEEQVRQRTEFLTETMQQLESQMQVVSQKEKELEKLNTFLSAIANQAGVMIIATDENGIINFFNPEAEKKLGYSATEVIGRNTPEIFHDTEETAHRAIELSEEFSMAIPAGFETYVAKARRGLPNEEEWTYVCKDGHRFPVSLTIREIRGQGGQTTGFLGVAFDISTRRRAEEDLKLALEKEKELGEMKSRFISLASHEFRTPLSTILSSAYLLQKYTGSDDQPRRETHIQRIVSSVSLLNDILNDFLALDRIRENAVRPKLIAFDLVHLMETMVRDFDPIMKPGQRVVLSHSLPEWIHTDPSMVRNILTNLISNAIKYSGADSTIRVCAEVKDESLKISVSDEGIGIPITERQHLFERFFRAKNAINIQGTGLGLHIVERYVQMLNGKIDYKSEEAKGTEFFIEIPINHPEYEKDHGDRRQSFHS